jgi:hypothetical protein
VSLPSQLSPLKLGEGLLHVLLLVLDPPSHETEQTLHFSHSDHPPFTLNECVRTCNNQNWLYMNLDKNELEQDIRNIIAWLYIHPNIMN